MNSKTLCYLRHIMLSFNKIFRFHLIKCSNKGSNKYWLSNSRVFVNCKQLSVRLYKHIHISQSRGANFSILSHAIIYHKSNTFPIWICVKYSEKVCKRTGVTRTVVIKIVPNQLYYTLSHDSLKGRKTQIWIQAESKIRNVNLI